MKATGMTRRVDALGRVVIPKEIRKIMRIQEGSPLEIYTDSDGEIVLKKYSQIGDIKNLAESYARSLSEATGALVGISDMDEVIAAAGPGNKSLQNKEIAEKLEAIILDRKDVILDKDNAIEIVKNGGIDAVGQVVSVINNDGDAIGAVIMNVKKEEKWHPEIMSQLARIASDFLGEQFTN